MHCFTLEMLTSEMLIKCNHNISPISPVSMNAIAKQCLVYNLEVADSKYVYVKKNNVNIGCCEIDNGKMEKGEK